MAAIILALLMLHVTSTVIDGCPIVTTINGTCCEIKSNQFKFSKTLELKSQVYNITNFCGECEHVAEGYCDASTAGGGWLVIQRRDKQYSTSFHKGWMEYVDGFGDLNKEFWYGLEPMHCLTNQEKYELRIDFTFANGTKSYLHYSHFKVGSAADNYRLSISGFTGITPSDPFTTGGSNGQQFTTYDNDNDQLNGNCALNGHGDESGGWWHNQCNHINLNYNYKHKGGWGFMLINGWFDPIFIEMKLHPSSC